jgi:hypothetical protein
MAFVTYVAVDGDEQDARLDVIHDAIGRLASGQAENVSMGLDETGDVFMSISRGPGGIYVSVMAEGEEDEYELVDASKPPELVECVVGSWRQTLTLDALVQQPEVARAAEHFFWKGKRLPMMTWRKTEERYRRMAQGETVRRL